jgi:ABC-2 type transport system permease protein
MNNVYTIFKRELKGYFNSAIAYICITVFLVLVNWLFFRIFFVEGQAHLRNFFNLIPWIFLFFIPAITMRLWAEEKKLGTFEILMTLPVKDYEVVLGKFLASYLFLLITLALTIGIPVTAAYLGDPDWGPIIGGYLGLLLMGGVYLAIGLFCSSLTMNQIVAFVVSIAVSFALFIVGENIVLFALPRFLVPFFEYLGVNTHFASISRGVIDSRDIIYYLSAIAFFLYLNVRALESRKWG